MTDTTTNTLLRYALSSTSISSTLPLHLLPPDSRTPVTRFYRLSDKKLALGSQLLQRALLCETHQAINSNITLQSVKLWKDPESGRPGYILPEGTSEARIVDYNVSHHSGLVVLAALLPDSSGSPSSSGRRIGVDVVTTTLPPRASSAKDFLDSFTTPSAGIFTPYEITTINSQSTWPLRIRLFYIYWALKEAYVKATGTGLVTDLTKIEFRNVKVFHVEQPGVRRYTGARLYLNGVEQEGWYLEVEVFDLDEEEEEEEHGEGNMEKQVYIAIATQKEGLSGKDLKGEWKVVDMARDIERWDEARLRFR